MNYKQKKQKKTKKQEKSTKLRICLALSGGGARGLAHIPIIKGLQKNNIPINLVAGTSAGAIIGAYFCLYGEVDGLVDILMSMNKRSLLNLIDFNNPKESLLKGKKIEKWLDWLYQGKKFKDLIIPFKCIATEINKGESIVIEKGKLSKAVMKSISFPMVLPPIKEKGFNYVDGGVTSPLPIKEILKEKCDFIIGVDLYNKSVKKRPNKKAFFGINQIYNMIKIMDIFDKVIIDKELVVLKKDRINNKKIFILSPDVSGSDFFRFDRYRQILQKGEDEFRKRWPKIKKELMKKFR